ncbi:transporter substrate-binding domain-containing protein [Legionella fallonii]|uniref:Arginine ABC transporter, periplasmic binding protein n=1 Tax=Legionella fallonii LLAP-10 TaxID=1212491 RepID=A0A098G890_9GAMM|nr:transporter substrate-binding domain-containing protein [Legionella fallonii]CEG58199.1 Arginine ABC transporter, periplasmic binding protein [Legionella fallonii LLAP-10]
MNFIRHALTVFTLFISTLYAAGPPLNVGIQGFNPPFEIQGADNEIYGFDVDMMNGLCKIMDRTCVFHVIKFDLLLDAVESKKIDVAVSSITITAGRSALVNFSLPYLLSYSRFLGPSANKTQPFSLALLSNKKIGVEAGTIFADQIKVLGIINPTIKQYDTMELLVEALGKKDVDYILFDSPTATYWAANSGGEFSVIGPPLLYGYGFGIAINKEDRQLLLDINRALLQYQNSEEYKMNYNKYLEL